MLFLTLLACSAPCAALDPGLDVESVRRILAHTALASRPAPIEKVLESGAFRETLRLGQGKPDWNPRHPAWQAVHDRVRADLDTERPAIMSAIDADRPRVEELEHEQLLKIAAALAAADVRTILAYYDSGEGLRYQAFMQRIDSVAAEGIASSVGAAAPPAGLASASKADSQKSQRYLEMIRMSDTFQAMNAMADMPEAKMDPSGSAALGIMAAAAVASHRPELEALRKEYSADLPGFAAFQKTPAAQRLFRVMGGVALDSIPRMTERRPPDLFDSARRKYLEQWQAEYRAHAAP
jgi:hypothetical protein